MNKLILLFAVIILAATVSTAYTLTLLDQIVHGQLYNYELKFDLAWANPYWNLLRIAEILLGVIAASAVASAILSFKKHVSVKQPSGKVAPSPKPTITLPSTTHVVEKPTIMPAATSAPPALAPAPLPSDISGLIKCLHCGKAFTQPLRMLDFQGNRPRIVNICPFCNEIIPSTPPQDEREQDKKFQLKKKNNDHAPKTLASQPTN